MSTSCMSECSLKLPNRIIASLDVSAAINVLRIVSANVLPSGGATKTPGRAASADTIYGAYEQNVAGNAECAHQVQSN